MLPSPHGNHTEEDEEQDRDEAAPCRGAGLGAGDRGGSVAAWGCREEGGAARQQRVESSSLRGWPGQLASTVRHLLSLHGLGP